jgi:hypothetical protein
MFCPICRSEYREGFTICAECDAQLVEELPSEPDPEFVDYDEVLSTFNPADIALIESVLDAADIDHFFHDENFGCMEPLAFPIKLMVRKDQVQDTKEILGDLELSFSGVNLPNDEEDDDD